MMKCQRLKAAEQTYERVPVDRLTNSRERNSLKKGCPCSSVAVYYLDVFPIIGCGGRFSPFFLLLLRDESLAGDQSRSPVWLQPAQRGVKAGISPESPATATQMGNIASGVELKSAREHVFRGSPNFLWLTFHSILSRRISVGERSVIQHHGPSSALDTVEWTMRRDERRRRDSLPVMAK
ncbi:hypothetical protein MHYP_G00354870 [Metynnis hypsauchen]